MNANFLDGVLGNRDIFLNKIRYYGVFIIRELEHNLKLRLKKRTFNTYNMDILHCPLPGKISALAQPHNSRTNRTPKRNFQNIHLSYFTLLYPKSKNKIKSTGCPKADNFYVKCPIL